MKGCGKGWQAAKTSDAKTAAILENTTHQQADDAEQQENDQMRHGRLAPPFGVNW
jgi:hypothetical protein